MKLKHSRPTDQTLLPAWFSGVHWLVSISFLAFTAFALTGLQFLSFDDDLASLFKGNSREYREFEKYTQLFGSDDGQCVVLLSAADVLDVQSLKLLRGIDTVLRENDNIRSVNSICDLLLPKRVGRMFFSVVPFQNAEEARWKSVRKCLVNHPLGMGILYSRDCRHTIVSFEMNRDLDRAQSALEIETIKSKLQEMWLDEDLVGSREIGFTGLPIIRNEVTTSLQRDQKRFTILGLLFSLAIGWFLLRKPLPVFFVAAIPFSGLGCIMGLLGWLNIPLNIVNNVVTPLVLVIGFAEAIHVLFVTGAFIGNGDRPATAVIKMLRQLLVPCLLAALTTAIGFGSLFLSEDNALREFAVVASVSSILMFLFVLLVSSCLLASPLGMYCVRPEKEEQGRAGSTSRQADPGNSRGYSSFRVSAVVCVFAVVCLAVFLSLSIHNITDYRFTENLPESNQAANTLWKIDRVMGGSSKNLLVVEFLRKPDPKQLIRSLRKIQLELEKNPVITKTVSFLNLLDSMPGGPADLISKFRELKYLPNYAWKSFLKINPTVASFVVKLPDLGSDRLNPRIREIVQQAEKLERDNPNLSMHFVGLNVLAVSRSKKMISDLIASLLGASVIIFALIMVVYRSLLFGLAAIVVNAFPILGVAAMMEWMGQPIQYNGIMLLCTCLGLAVDDTVHFLSKLKIFLAQGLEFKVAVKQTVKRLWPVLLTTSIILGVGFGLASTSDIPTFQTFGGYACVALGLALVGDLLILPHVLIVLHRIFVKP